MTDNSAGCLYWRENTNDDELVHSTKLRVHESITDVRLREVRLYE